MHLSHQNFCYKFQVKSDKKCDAALKDKCEDICTKLDGYVEKVFLTVLVSRIYSVGNLRKGGNKLHVPIGPHSKVRCSQCDKKWQNFNILALLQKSLTIFNLL